MVVATPSNLAYPAETTVLKGGLVSPVHSAKQNNGLRKKLRRPFVFCPGESTSMDGATLFGAAPWWHQPPPTSHAIHAAKVAHVAVSSLLCSSLGRPRPLPAIPIRHTGLPHTTFSGPFAACWPCPSQAAPLRPVPVFRFHLSPENLFQFCQ